MIDRDTKLIAILRRQYHIILTALGENIFRIGLRRFATPPNTEYIFSQLAVNMYWLLTKREVKMTGYWPSSFFACLWTETKSRSINTQKKNEANIQSS